MENYPLEKYKYRIIENKNMVIATSTYAGKRVTGRAVCASDDEFDVEKGKKLAAYRCNAKVAMKRFNRARKALRYSKEYLEQSKKYSEKCQNYFKDSFEQLLSADRLLKDFEETLK